jgi:cysteine-rich repeat protein
VLSLLAACAPSVESSSASLPGEVLPPPSAQPELSLTVSRVQAATTLSMTVGGLSAGESVYLLRGSSSASPGLCPGVAGGMCLELAGPVTVMGTAIADGAGVARLQLTLPASVPAGLEVWFQAAAVRGSGGSASVRSPAVKRVTGQQPALGVADLLAGDLVITEVLQDPTAVADAAGEWFEVENLTGAAVDLAGLEVTDLGSDRFVVPRSVVVPAGDRAVFGVNDDPATNGGVAVDVEWAGLTLGNADDELILTAPDGEIDAVAWDDGLTFPDPAGQSMSLDPRHLDADDNDDGALWCARAGSPGLVNPQCPLPFCGDGTVDPGEQCDDGGTAVGDGCDASCQLEGCPVPEIVTGEWTITVPGAAVPDVSHVVDAANGDLFVAGTSYPGTNRSVWLARYDGATMGLEWVQQWYNIYLRDQALAVLPTASGGAALFAQSFYTGASSTEMWYAEVGAGGALVTTRESHDVVPGDPTLMLDVDAANGGTYWVAGEVDGHLSYGLRINAAGGRVQTWDGMLAAPYNDNGAVAVRSLPDGGALFANRPGWFVRIDVNGNTVWSKVLGDAGFDVEDMTSTPDGGMVAVGTGAAGKTLVRIDGSGNLLWTRALTAPAGFAVGYAASSVELVPRTCDVAPTAGATCATDGEWCATTAGTCTCDGVWVCDGAAQEAVVAWEQLDSASQQAPALTRLALDGAVRRTLRLGSTGTVTDLFVGRGGEVRALTSADKLFRLDPALDGSCSSSDTPGVSLVSFTSSFLPVVKDWWLGRWGTYPDISTINTTAVTPNAPAVAMSCGGLSCP